MPEGGTPDTAAHPTPARPGHWFTTTHWSVVLAAKADDTRQSDAALETLCRTYWPPVYAFIRREGHTPEDAQDLTQEFLSRFVHREWLNHLQDQRGKFRSFLLTFLKHFLSDQRDRARAQKRGGDRAIVSLEQMAEEERAWSGPLDHATPEQAYERRWAQAVMDRAVERLRSEYAARDKSALFEALKDLQPGERGRQHYAEMGAQLGLSEQAVNNAVHRFRRRYAELLREEIAQTVLKPDEVQAEVRHLLQLFAH